MASTLKEAKDNAAFMHPDRAKRGTPSSLPLSPSAAIDADDVPVTLGGKKFHTRDELITYFRTILHQQKEGYVFKDEEFDMAVALLQTRPDYHAKVGSGLEQIMVGHSLKFPETKCFMFKRAARTAKNIKKASFLPGVILKFEGHPRDATMEDAKKFFVDIDKNVERVDHEEGQSVSYVRFDHPATLSSVIKKMARDRPRLMGREITVQCLIGKEESDYWADYTRRLIDKKAEKARKAMERAAAGSRGRGRGRGRGGFRGGGRGGAPYRGNSARGGGAGGGGGGSSSSHSSSSSSGEKRGYGGGGDEGGAAKRYRDEGYGR